MWLLIKGLIPIIAKNYKLLNVRKLCFLLSGFLLNISVLHAQFYDSGQDPASIRWKQINTESFRIIFPGDFENEANRLANTLTYIIKYVSKSLNHKPRKISIIIHSQSSYSNGFVTWAPKRMELYPTPAQDSYAQDWLDQLAVHELRHVVQIDKLNQGLTHILSIMFGEQAVGFTLGLIPRCFFEGDAVNTETALSATGRGRDAAFQMEMKTLVVSNPKLFSYEKALLGSYKDYVPDYYKLGYPMVAWSRSKFGPAIYDKTLNYVGRNPYLFFPFSLKLRKETGFLNRQLYQATYSDLKLQWSKDISIIPNSEVTQWNTRKSKLYTSYRFPQYVNDTTLLAVKSGIDQVKQFVLLYKNGNEKVIHTPGNYYSDKFSYAAGKYVWAEEIPDVRWGNRSFYCIKTGNINGKVKMLTKNSRYFAPDISPDGTKIAAVEVTRDNQYYLVILDAGTGSVIDRFSPPENKFIQLPEWIANGNEIAVVTTGKKGKSLDLLDISSKCWKTLFGPTYRNISLTSDAGAFIIFGGEFNGINNLYALKKTDQSLWQITNEKYGAFDPDVNPNNNVIVFSQYSSQGYNAVSCNLSPLLWAPVKELDNFQPADKLFEVNAGQEKFNFQDSTLPNNVYATTPYSKLTHLLNVHSWSPFYFNYQNLNLDYTYVTPGFTLLSQDKLGTCNSFFGLSYFGNQPHWITGITYKGLYPLFNFSLNYGGTEVFHKEAEINLTSPASNQKIDLSTMVYLPLNLTRGRFNKGITPSVQWEYRNEWFYNPSAQQYKQGMHYIRYVLNAYWYLKESYRDLAPKWGMDLTARYTSTPFENTQLKSIWSVRSRLYLPGIIKHHSFQVVLAHQKQDALRYLYSSLISFPRGYSAQTTYQLKTLFLDYAFPVAYPDFHIAPILYLKRIRSDIFYDIANNKYREKNTWYSKNLTSTGIDLTSDFHLLRIIFPFNAGVRMIYFPQTGNYTTQLLFRIDLTNF